MQLRILLLFLTMAIICLFSTAAQAAGTYLDSAHGSTTYGVDRLAGFAVANCAHCHEQHASVGGSEPPPVTNAKEYLLFDQSNTDQAANFCFDCHTSVSAYQQVTNRSYSYRAGGWNLDPLDNIKSAFSQASSHNLKDIVDFTVAKGWNLAAAKVNACAVCHDPHVVQGDPANLPNSTKTNVTRGGAITEINTSPGNLWGDEVGEMMAPDYTINYQAPYRVGGGSYEPAGPTQDGSDLPDYVAFCIACHSDASVYSTERVQNLRVINWANEIHGQSSAVNIAMDEPYASSAFGPPFVLSCLDCHEPHGSGNLYLLRGEVNGGETTIIASGVDFEKICIKCHNRVGADWDDAHHNTDSVYNRNPDCNSQVGCHNEAGPVVSPIDCSNCHFHGSDTDDVGVLAPDNPPGLRVTF